MVKIMNWFFEPCDIMSKFCENVYNGISHIDLVLRGVIWIHSSTEWILNELLIYQDETM